MSAPAADRHAIGTDAANAVAHTLKALADPLRLRMLSAIATSPDGEASAGDLATLTDAAQPTVSHHLKVLREVGLLASERRGTYVLYRIEPGYRGAVATLLDRFAPTAVGIADAPHLPGLTDVDRELTGLGESLARRIPGISREKSLAVVRESYAALARRGGIPTHLVTLTERFAHQRLTDAARKPGVAPGNRPAAHPPQILFVCVANAGRSQLAAALAAHHAGDRVVVRSAGSMPAPDVHRPVQELLDEIDRPEDTRVTFPKPLTDDALRAADVVVTMGCGDTCPVLPGTRYEDWVVGDPALASPAGVAAIRDEIDRRVRELLADLLPDMPL